ncbi:AmmeMemoRadiSam system protein B [Chloroflexi bacterium TSY]|nr:AmmeMemoRadiSam system protein B [Chloroflexi bacterium TSY]
MYIDEMIPVINTTELTHNIVSSFSYGHDISCPYERTLRESYIEQIRPPAAAGRLYPAASNTLRATILNYLEEASDPYLTDVRAILVPHAGYSCSGRVAARGFKALDIREDVECTVFMLGPAHLRYVNGVGLSNIDAFETPLGVVPVATEIVNWLFDRGQHYHLAAAAHAPEHCLEVELPFLQVMIPHFRIVPMLFDEAADPQRVAGDLVDALATDPHTLVVVSSDLSHHHPYVDAVERDSAFLTAVADDDVEAVRAGEACGRLPILCLMYIAQQMGRYSHGLAYANSGDTCGPRRDVVGYGAVAYTSA